MGNLKDLVPGITDLKVVPHEGAKIRLEATRSFNHLAVKRAVSQLLKGFGVDTRDENFEGTPSRVTKMWGEWLSPITLDVSAFKSASKGAVTLTGHTSVSVCPHHLLPFEVSADVVYVPQGYVVGLSKLPRIVDLACRSFILQEHIGEFVTELLTLLLTPLGVACRVRSAHGCMRMRGVKTNGLVTTTSVSGVFLQDEKARHEFLGEAWHHG